MRCCDEAQPSSNMCANRMTSLPQRSEEFIILNPILFLYHPAIGIYQRFGAVIQTSTCNKDDILLELAHLGFAERL